MRRFLLMLGVAAFFLSPPAARAQSDEPYLGQILLVSFNFAPRGWVMCNGQIMSISQNQALFALLGTTFGGDGETTFALPDLRGRVPIGFGQGAGLQNYPLGQSGGEEQVTLTIAQIPAHTHTIMGQSALGTTAGPSGGVWAAQSRLPVYSSTTANATMNSGAIATTGQSQPHDNRSPYLTLNYIIALQGIFPSQN